jgi:hypothetical protein
MLHVNYIFFEKENAPASSTYTHIWYFRAKFFSLKRLYVRFTMVIRHRPCTLSIHRPFACGIQSPGKLSRRSTAQVSGHNNALKASKQASGTTPLPRRIKGHPEVLSSITQQHDQLTRLLSLQFVRAYHIRLYAGARLGRRCRTR